MNIMVKKHRFSFPTAYFHNCFRINPLLDLDCGTRGAEVFCTECVVEAHKRESLIKNVSNCLGWEAIVRASEGDKNRTVGGWANIGGSRQVFLQGSNWAYCGTRAGVQCNNKPVSERVILNPMKRDRRCAVVPELDMAALEGHGCRDPGARAVGGPPGCDIRGSEH